MTVLSLLRTAISMAMHQKYVKEYAVQYYCAG
jgi:hypothetical protein